MLKKLLSKNNLNQNKQSDENRFKSFAPIRENNGTEACIDGRELYQSVYESMNKAKQEILISAWFLSPEVSLVRYKDGKLIDDSRFKLMNVLKAKASQGVMVYVLLWNETSIAFKLDSSRVEEVLENLNDKINVVRHPKLEMKWTQHQKIVIVDQKVAYVGGLDLCFGRFDDPNHKLFDNTTVQCWKGKDYYNPEISEIKDLKHPTEDYFERNSNPRMPWHDVSVKITGPSVRDLVFNFVQRWNNNKKDVFIGDHKPSPLTKGSVLCTKKGYSRVQFVRSVTEWSFGEKTEDSVHSAYISLIEGAKYFIYIENQFFISSAKEDPEYEVKNKVGQAIAQRIIKAIDKNQTFKVIIVVPVHPEGSVLSNSVRMCLAYTMRSLIWGPNSIVEVVKEKHPTVNISDYISFHHLIQFQQNKHLFFQMQIYVHSKIMIVDDLHVIIGSANINDRSLLGSRDSEIACVISDKTEKLIKMNGLPFKASLFAYRLRKKLWREHCGNSLKMESYMIDPILGYDSFKSISSSNYNLITTVFPFVPISKIQGFQVLQDCAPVSEYTTENLLGVEGQVVDMINLNEDHLQKMNIKDSIEVGVLGLDIFL